MTTYDTWLLTGGGGPLDDELATHCQRCHEPLTMDDQCEFGVCLECCRAEAQQAIDDEVDALNAAADVPEPAPVPCGDELPF